jgi:hypothetical protein
MVRLVAAIYSILEVSVGPPSQCFRIREEDFSDIRKENWRCSKP